MGNRCSPWGGGRDQRSFPLPKFSLPRSGADAPPPSLEKAFCRAGEVRKAQQGRRNEVVGSRRGARHPRGRQQHRASALPGGTAARTHGFPPGLQGFLPQVPGHARATGPLEADPPRKILTRPNFSGEAPATRGIVMPGLGRQSLVSQWELRNFSGGRP